MTILEKAFAEYNAEQVSAPEVRTELFTPCGVRFTTEPMYNTATGMHDCIMYVFDTGEQIIVDDELDSFHEAYVQYCNEQFSELQVPVEKPL